MNIGILGYGIVGKATEYSIGRDISAIVDKNDDIKTLYSCHIVFICIPTNTSEDIQQLCALVGNIADNLRFRGEIVIRSTVAPGTINSLIQKHKGTSICYWPEFLRERSFLDDSVNSPTLHTQSIYLPHLINATKIYDSAEQLEIIKLMSNVWSCTLITFSNHMHQLCQQYDVDFDPTMAVMKSTRLQSYTEGGRPFGGKCLPKDLDFLIQELKDLGLEESFFTAMKEDNSRF